MDEFKKLAAGYFRPVIERYHLDLIEEKSFWLDYGNSRVLLRLAYDARRTREVVASIAPLYDSGDPYYRFGFELALILRYKNAAEQVRNAAVGSHEVEDELRCRSGLIAKYCGKLLDGDLKEFEGLEEYGRRIAHEYTQQGQMRSATVRAGWALAAGDLGKVVRELTPHENLLDQAWTNKLIAARRAVGRKKQP